LEPAIRVERTTC